MKISGTHGPGRVAPLTLQSPATQPAEVRSSTDIEDTVTLSSTARARERAAAHPRFGGLSVAAHLDPELADQLAYDYGHLKFQPMLDLREREGARNGVIRYSATGEPVTPESEALFAQLAAGARAASLALYNAETAKGTDPADIFDKLIALGDAQPVELRQMANWELMG